MNLFPKPMQKLIKELSKLPTIGEKSATRLAYHLIAQDPKLADSLSDALKEAAHEIKFCNRCFFFSESDVCSICAQAHRNSELLCVVEKPMDVISFERLGEFKGYYHVLHGVWAPLRGQGPESMKLKELVERVKEGQVKEIILATSSTVEGDATALYIGRLLAELNIVTSRLAQGMPKGGELEYMDDVTLSRALQGRASFSGM
ncbi:MAG: recombination protein RecR [Bdellovibrionales bacterium]|nr:recombination protein RecR [Bdellovibrionales bacterium]